MKKVLAVFLNLIMILSLVSITVFAADEILAVIVLNIDAPEDGAEFDRFADIPNGQPYNIFSQPEWYDETDKRFLEMGDSFEAGHIYTVNVWLEANDGYEFKSTDSTTDVTASINGKTAEAGKAYEYQRWAMVVVSYTFPAVEKAKPVDEVKIEIAKPKPGEKVSFDAKLTGEGVKMMERIPDLASVYQYAIRGVQWEDRTINHKMSEGETFTTGHEYGLSVFIEPKDGYKLDDSYENYEVTINGSKPTAIGGFSEVRRGYYISYNCIDEVGEVSFNVVEPEVGIAPYFDIIPISPSVERNVSDIVYYDKSTREHSTREYIETDTTFEEGHYYEVRFRATAKDGYEFSSDENGEVDVSKILVNEHPVTDAYYLSTWSKQYIEVVCVYDALKKGEKSMPIQYDNDECIDGVIQYVKVYDVAPPKAGELPDQVGVTLSDYYRVPHCEGGKTAFRWINVTDGKDMDLEKDKFENGKEYEVRVGISTFDSFKNDANGKADFKGYIDGIEVDEIILLDNELYDGDAVLVYNFGVLGEENKLNFVDVPKGEYYYDAVKWAVGTNITNGTSDNTFSPSKSCSRAEVVTFLWRANGCPAPSSTENPFSDVPTGQWYTNAVLWAVERGITTGTGGGKFNPDKVCTRAEVVTFLKRAVAKDVVPSATDNPFADVPAGQWYTEAVLWAVEKGITTGTSTTTFSPDTICTRAQVVTFLYRLSTLNK